MIEALISLLAPHRCLVCKTEGALLCAWCAPDAMWHVPERCYRCQAASVDSAVCAACRSRTPLAHLWVRGLYKDTAKQLLYALKFSRAKAAATIIGQLLDETVPALPLGTVVTYIPTATSRVRLRGYDHARLIAMAFASQRGLPVRKLLLRIGQSRQVGADRTHRQSQAAKNYIVPQPATCKGLEILLIDDIMTTGATVESAAAQLKKAGAKKVHAAVFAQKQ